MSGTALRGRWRENFPMSKLSTWRVGGPASAVFEPADLADLRAFFAARVNGDSPPVLFIGHGSNLLVRDGGFRGVVVRAAPGLSELKLESDGTVYAEAGVACAKAARFCAARGLAEAEFLAGIPGAIGGALAMNAGCHGAEIWSYVERALTEDENGERVLSAEHFAADYREVKMMSGDAPPFSPRRGCVFPPETRNPRGRDWMRCCKSAARRSRWIRLRRGRFFAIRRGTSPVGWLSPAD